MIKIINSEDFGLIEDQLAQETYDDLIELKKDEYDSIILSIGQMNIFSYNDSKKIYCIKDMDKIFSSKIDKKIESFLQHFIELEIDAIFISEIKTVHKSFEELFNKNIISIKKLNRLTIKQYIKKISKDLNLKNEIVDFLANKLPLNSLNIKSEINKISLLKNNDINIESISKLINQDNNENVFNLINYFLEKNTEKVIYMINYFELIKVDFFEIFNIMISQIFSLKLYLIHYEKYNDINKMLSDFNLQLFQIKDQIKIIKNRNLSFINKLLNDLLTLNVNFMNNKKNLEIELKLLLINGDEYGL